MPFNSELEAANAAESVLDSAEPCLNDAEVRRLESVVDYLREL